MPIQNTDYYPLPQCVKALFWDYDPEVLSWDKDRDLIISRVLHVGDWDSVIWLRSHLENQDLGQWLQNRAGAGLSPPQLRFWELILGIPPQDIEQWLMRAEQNPWNHRVHQ